MLHKSLFAYINICYLTTFTRSFHSLSPILFKWLQNRGVYMFRIDNDTVCDATMAGGPARYINHSCDPNCVAEVVDIDKDSKIIIITNRRITQGEEVRLGLCPFIC